MKDVAIKPYFNEKMVYMIYLQNKFKKKIPRYFNLCPEMPRRRGMILL